MTLNGLGRVLSLSIAYASDQYCRSIGFRSRRLVPRENHLAKRLCRRNLGARSECASSTVELIPIVALSVQFLNVPRWGNFSFLHRGRHANVRSPAQFGRRTIASEGVAVAQPTLAPCIVAWRCRARCSTSRRTRAQPVLASSVERRRNRTVARSYGFFASTEALASGTAVMTRLDENLVGYPGMRSDRFSTPKANSVVGPK
jgi:hypothetical protein